MTDAQVNRSTTFRELLESIFSFQGRLGRVKFVLGHLIAAYFFGGLVFLVVQMLAVSGIVKGSAVISPENYKYLVYSLLLLANVLTSISILSVVARRFQDINLSRYWSLLYVPPMAINSYLYFIPVEVWQSLEVRLMLGSLAWQALVFLALLVWPGASGENKYGPAPE